MGYHLKEIEKGTLGCFSKIEEEWEELLDARTQHNEVLEICELCDLIGAIEAYTSIKWNLPLQKLIQMMSATKSAFNENKRN